MANDFDRRLLLMSGVALALAGCGGLGLGPTNPDATIYVLAPTTPATPGGQASGWALAVDIPDATDSLDSRRIALIKADATLDYYANAQWPDRLPLLVQTALVAAFEANGRAPQVSRTQDALHADYELGVDIRDFAAHYSAPDGIPAVTVILVAQISTAHSRKIVASFTATANASASQNSTGGVVAAFNTAAAAAMQQIVTWTLGLNLPAVASP